jgi:hypothetical protein
MANIKITFFSIMVKDGKEEAFIKEVTMLCEKYAVVKDAFHFRYDVEG